MKICVLCSGILGLEVLKEVSAKLDVVVVFTDEKSVLINEYCHKCRIPLFIGNPRKGRGKKFIKNYEIDVLISINYLFLIEKDIYSYPRLLSFNIHGSLLPKYRGRTPHVWAIINNEKETGITAHKIDEGCDTGDIILQSKIKISRSETGYDILQKFNIAYKNMVFEVLEKLKAKTIGFRPQDHSLATYFCKRTPSDGQIDWNWQKERIFNWVRAQAYPYPGAFTHYKNKKVIIDEIQFTNLGFAYNMPNGLIINDNPLQVKTPNGAISITKYRAEMDLQSGEIFKYI